MVGGTSFLWGNAPWLNTTSGRPLAFNDQDLGVRFGYNLLQPGNLQHVLGNG